MLCRLAPPTVGVMGLVELSSQYWVGDCVPTDVGVKPLANQAFIKPLGGFWTSSCVSEFSSGWTEYLYSPDGVGLSQGDAMLTLLTPSAKARVLSIDSQEDLEEVAASYGLYTDFRSGKPVPFSKAIVSGPDSLGGIFHLDFEALALQYDGLHLSEDGQYATRFPAGSRPSLYGWDVESTCWFRWAFTSARHVADFSYSNSDVLTVSPVTAQQVSYFPSLISAPPPPRALSSAPSFRI